MTLCKHEVPVVILCGGRGSRLGEFTDSIPKPMVKVKGVPIIDRIMDNFRADGFERFILSAGYKWEVLDEHFKDRLDVEVVFTGLETQTAGRLHGVKDLLGDTFMACYGDGLTDYRPKELLSIHQSTSPTCTCLVVHPLGRFGELNFNARGQVTKFSEKPMGDKWINGGYFCFSPSIFDYIHRDTQVLETDVFNMLVRDGELFCDSYEGFWHSVDTPKDLADMEKLLEL